MALTDQQVINYLSTPRSDAEIAAAMVQFNVPAEQVARVTNMPTEEVSRRVTAALAPAPSLFTDFARDVSAVTTPTPTAAPVTAPAPAPTTSLFTDFARDAAAVTGQSAPPNPQTVQAVKNFLTENPNLDANQITAAMNKYGVTVNDVAAALDISPSQVKEQYDKSMAIRSAAAKGEVPPEVKNALESQSLTKEQYNVLSAYFNNDMVLDEEYRDPDTPTLRNFIGRTTGADFAGFLATRYDMHGGDPNTAKQAYSTLISPYQGKEVTYRQDESGNFLVKDPITGKELLAQQVGPNTWSTGLATLAGSGPYQAGGFALSNTFTVDPATGKATYSNPDIQYVAPKQKWYKEYAPIISAALMFIPGMQGWATALGTAVGASGAAATAIGTGIITGTTTGVITGDEKLALVTALTTGLGNYASTSGLAGDLLNKVGLGDLAQNLGLPTSNVVADANFYAEYAKNLAAQGIGSNQISEILTASGLGPGAASNVAQLAAGGANTQSLVSSLQNATGGMFSANVSDVQFISTDAARQAAQGLSADQIRTNLIATGVDPFIASDAAQLALSGANATAIAQNLAQSGAGMNLFPGVTLGPDTGLSTTTGGAQDLITQLQNQGLLTPPPVVPPTGTPGGTTTPPGTTTPGTPTIPGLPNIPNLSTLLSGLTGTGSLTGLLGTGIDYARLQAISDAATRQGRQLGQEAAAIGVAAQTPFTPYTLTTGAGTATISPGAATATAAAPYETLRQQALTQAQQTLGAINPAQATEQFYQNLEALAGTTRQREQEQLLSTLGARGLLGIGRNLPTAGGEVRGVNPFQEALLSAQEQGRIQQALTAQQYGTAEAARQQALAQNLQAQAMGIDTQTLRQLETARALGTDERALAERNAALRSRAALAGLELRAPYEQLGLLGQIQGINAAAGAGRGLLGLPTQPGSTGSTNLVSQALNYLTGTGMSAAQAADYVSSLSSGLDISGNSQATQNLINDLQRYGIF